MEEREALEYNTDRDNLVLPEYGRYLQKLANSIKRLKIRKSNVPILKNLSIS
ncbi:MAG: DUF4290 domain-containing protein [Candidatus Parvibacillus calidus]|nr:MAG: DUF4290 domain-containing protein [Candidatus Parvibacillus calidus]